MSDQPQCACGKPATTVQIDEEPVDRSPLESGSGHLVGEWIAAASLVPSAETWLLRCDECGSREPSYWFKIERIDTPKKALGWTAHLSDKVWFAASRDSWFALMERLFPGFEEC